MQISAHGAAIVCCGLILIAVGQPIFTDDIWWHLSLGAAYLRDGPWLEADPLLFTALTAPPPTSTDATDVAEFPDTLVSIATVWRKFQIGSC